MDILVPFKTPREADVLRVVYESTRKQGYWDLADLHDDSLNRERLWYIRAFEDLPGIRVWPFPVWQDAIWSRLLYRFWKPGLCGWAVHSRLAGWLLRSANTADVIISTFYTGIATTLFLKSKGLLRIPIWCVLVGVADRLESLPTKERSDACRILALADRLLVWSPGEARYLTELGLDKVTALPFGVDIEFWQPSRGEPDDYVLSVGSDPARDHDILLEACPVPLRVVSRTIKPEMLANKPNVALYEVDTVGLRDLYDRARIVAVPTNDVMQPSGQSTVLQAMAMGRPVVLTRIQGPWTDKLVSGKNCLMVPPGDQWELRRAILQLWNDPVQAASIGAAARQTVMSHFRWENLKRALVALLTAVK